MVEARAVLFDLDDTLYDQAIPFARAVHAVVGPIEGATDAALYAASRAHSGEIFAAYGEGRDPTQAMYARRMIATLADFDCPVTEDVALQIQRRYMARTGNPIELSAPMRGLLDDLAARNVRLGVVTNGNGERQRAKARQLGLDRWMPARAIVVSEDVGLAKPDPAIFALGAQRLDVPAEACVFVGDSIDADVRGAQAAGMAAVWIDRRDAPAPAGARFPVVRTDAELRALLG